MRYFFGVILFWCFFPLMLFLGFVWWKKDTAFMVRNLRILFTGREFK